MALTKYSKWQGVDWESLSLEDLLDRLADFLLQSGFETQYSRYWGEEEERTLDALRDAIMRALMEGLLSDEELDSLSDDRGELDEEAVSRLLDRLIERPTYREYDRTPTGGGRIGKPIERSIKFEMTDKGLDFLGFKALRELIA